MRSTHTRKGKTWTGIERSRKAIREDTSLIKAKRLRTKEKENFFNKSWYYFWQFKFNSLPKTHWSKKILEFIHGGVEASLYAAWDYFKSNAPSELTERLFLSFKRGNFLVKLYGNCVEIHSFLSRRKYNFLSKIQQHTYDPQNESYRKNMMSYGDYKLEM